MLTYSNAFSSFSVADLDEARSFYANTLGLTIIESEMGTIDIRLNDSCTVIAYPKGKAHQAASFTILNFVVDDLEAAVDQLTRQGIRFEQYGGEIKTDEKGIFHGKEKDRGPNIAWFKDPSDNILSLIEE